MVNRYVADIERALSSDRLMTYRTSGSDDAGAITTYFFNIALCQALYTPLGAVEVVVRNSLHRELSKLAGTEVWYDRLDLLDRERRDVASARKGISSSGKEVTPGRVVATLPFGFWTSLLAGSYGDRPSGPRLWLAPGDRLASVFPYAPPRYRGVRSRTHARIDDLRLLRNRVFHYEPVWRGLLLPSRKPGRPMRTASLADLHDEIIDTIGWVNPTLAETIRALDTFALVSTSGYSSIDTIVRSMTGD